MSRTARIKRSVSLPDDVVYLIAEQSKNDSTNQLSDILRFVETFPSMRWAALFSRVRLDSLEEETMMIKTIRDCLGDPIRMEYLSSVNTIEVKVSEENFQSLGFDTGGSSAISLFKNHGSQGAILPNLSKVIICNSARFDPGYDFGADVLGLDVVHTDENQISAMTHGTGLIEHCITLAECLANPTGNQETVREMMASSDKSYERIVDITWNGLPISWSLGWKGVNVATRRGQQSRIFKIIEHHFSLEPTEIENLENKGWDHPISVVTALTRHHKISFKNIFRGNDEREWTKRVWYG